MSFFGLGCFDGKIFFPLSHPFLPLSTLLPHARQNTIKQHRRFVRRRQLSLYSEVLLQDCYMLQTGQAILLPGEE